MYKKGQNYDKRDMYVITTKRLKKAIQSKCYYEAIMLDYALIEDRLSKTLYLLGIVNINTDGLKVTKKSKEPLRWLLDLSSNQRFMINNIGTKISVIRLLVEKDTFYNSHFEFTSKVLKNDKVDINVLMKDVDSWRNKRNGLVHGLMNKVPFEVEPQLKEIAEQGFDYFRQLDNLVGRLEKYSIRRDYKIQ